MAGPVISLLTDFGLQDNSIGAMKGVILGICPESHIADICHWVPPQNIAVGGFLLERTYRYFPKGSVHVAVVDPGVGGKRRPLAMTRDGHFFVGPDNGLFTAVLENSQASPDDYAVELTNPTYQLPEVSNTFHGRDIFAPAGAWLGLGVPLRELGAEIKNPVRLPGSVPRTLDTGHVECHVVYVDRFGNLITDLDGNEAHRLESQWGELWFTVGTGTTVGPMRRSYDAVKAGDLVAVVGGFDRLEIAVNQGNAQSRLGVHYGDVILAHGPDSFRGR